MFWGCLRAANTVAGDVAGHTWEDFIGKVVAHTQSGHRLVDVEVYTGSIDEKYERVVSNPLGFTGAGELMLSRVSIGCYLRPLMG